MEALLGDLFGWIIGLCLGIVFVIPLMVLVFGSGLAGVAKVLESIIS